MKVIWDRHCNQEERLKLAAQRRFAGGIQTDHGRFQTLTGTLRGNEHSGWIIELRDDQGTVVDTLRDGQNPRGYAITGATPDERKALEDSSFALSLEEYTPPDVGPVDCPTREDGHVDLESFMKAALDGGGQMPANLAEAQKENADKPQHTGPKPVVPVDPLPSPDGGTDWSGLAQQATEANPALKRRFGG